VARTVASSGDTYNMSHLPLEKIRGRWCNQPQKTVSAKFAKFGQISVTLISFFSKYREREHWIANVVTIDRNDTNITYKEYPI
jgi:hypothetical protein